MTPRLSIIVPVLDEAAGITAALDALAPLRARGAEIVVVDGGSSDATVVLSRPRADAVIDSPRGRARQMNAGAAVAQGGLLLFLHADTRLPPQADPLMQQALERGADWGRFDVRIDGRPRMLRIVAAMMNLRSRLTGIATGDQAVFMRRELFARVGGFPVQPLMEDIELSKRLRRHARPACLRQTVITSGRRWEAHGVWRTIVLMWRLRWRYWRGTPAEVLAQWYR
ncbi:MAG TPA: TIGR04283 family arsenosugar biosynthesis glycosyltransferase [Rubrivivax sp.]|nr:TIGR04283 family arsenosugar biosynthesis glycosyltransferase [Rubrivivax sp.]